MKKEDKVISLELAKQIGLEQSKRMELEARELDEGKIYSAIFNEQNRAKNMVKEGHLTKHICSTDDIAKAIKQAYDKGQLWKEN